MGVWSSLLSVDLYASLALQQGVPADLMVVHLVCGISVTLYHGFALLWFLT